MTKRIGNILLALCLLLSVSFSTAHAQVFVTGSGGQFGTINPATGIYSSRGTLGGAVGSLSGMALSGGVLYGVAGVDGPDQSLYSVNAANGSTAFLKNIGAAFVSVAARGDGRLYGYSTTAGTSTLWSIDPVAESAATAIGALGIGTFDGLAFGGDGALYTSDTATGTLYRLDIATGAAAAVGGGIGTPDVYGYGLSGATFYGFALDRTIRSVDTSTGAGGTPVSYSFGAGQELDFVTSAAGAVIPEPTTLSLVLLALSGGAGARYRRACRRRA